MTKEVGMASMDWGAGRVGGKVAVVTGGASGIGRASAETLAREGAAVVLADLDESGAESVAAGIRSAGGTAMAVAVDVSDEASVAAMVAATTGRFGRVDVLHNSAALTDPEHQARDRSVAETDLAVWERSLAVDLSGTMLTCKYVIDTMLACGGGSIINTSSNSALAGDLTLAAYTAAKGGVNSLTLSIATAFGKQGVRCNAVSPACIRSPSLQANVSPEVTTVLEGSCLTPTMGSPQDVANAVLFLASDESAFITGQIVRVDGGALSHLPHFAYLRDSNRTTNQTDTAPARE